jgi:phage baseplate assembly protein V
MDPRERSKLNAKIRASAAYRAVIDETEDGSKMQEAKIAGQNGEMLEKIERFQQFGFTSRPKAGTEAIVLPIGGDRSHSVILAVDDRGTRKGNLEPGEAAVYSADGAFMHFKNEQKIETQAKELKTAAEDKIESETKEQITDATVSAEFKSPQLGFRGNLTATNYEGGAAVWRITGDVYIKGTFYIDGDVIVTGDVVAGGVSLRHHTHPGDSGGTTGAPA